MSVFKPADSIVRPFVKLAVDGYQGSGKSTTLAAAMIGVYKDFGVKGPAFIIDNETSAKFLVPLFREAGIEVQLVETDSLAVWLDALKEVEAVGGVLLIDSLTKMGNRMEKDYLDTVSNRAIKKVEIQDRPILNATWRDKFEEPFVKAKCHIGFTGRAVVDWGTAIEEDEQSGKKKRTFYAKGVKMAGQKESLYAPDWAIYMERVEEFDAVTREKDVYREGTIIKDRSRILDGKTFKWRPKDYGKTYSDLASMFRFLLSGPPGTANEVPGNAAQVFGEPEGDKVEQAAMVEEIKNDLLLAHPGQDAASKTAKVKALRECFGVSAWEHIQRMAVAELQAGREKLTAYLKPQPKAAPVQAAQVAPVAPVTVSVEAPAAAPEFDF